MKRNFLVILIAVLLLSTGSAFSQPQLQLQALTAIAGPAYQIQVQGPRVVVYGDVGFLCFEYDSVQQNLALKSILQATHDVGKMVFHPHLPLLYILMDELNSSQNCGLLVINWTNIDQPEYYDPPNPDFSEITTFDISGDSLYVYKHDHLYIFDNSDPWNPRLTSMTYLWHYAHEIRIEGHHLHGICGLQIFYGKYGMMDIIDPSNPVLLTFDLFPYVGLQDVGGGHSAISNGSGLGLATYQISESYPYIIGPTYHSGKYAPARCTPDGSIYARGASGIYKYANNSWTWTGVDTMVYDFQVRGNLIFANKALPKTEVWQLNSTNAVLLDTFNYSPIHPSIVELKGIAAIIPGENGSSRFYDISEPASPVLVTQLDSCCGTMCISGNYLYVNEGTMMSVVDIATIFQPHVVSNVTLPPLEGYGLIVTNDTLVFISGTHRLLAYDITNPETPQLVANHYEPYYWYKLIHTQHGCLITSSSNLYKLYRADASLQLLSTISAGSDETPFIVGEGDSLILGDLRSFRIYSIANPISPQLLSRTPFPGYNPSSYYAAFDGNYLYVDLRGYPRWGDDCSLTVFDLTPGTQTINLVDHIQVADNSFGQIAVENGLILFAQWSCVGIYSFTDSTQTPINSLINQPSLLDNFSFTSSPNPFNPTTNLTFTLPHPAKVSLEVFDINGRAVGAHCVRPVGGAINVGARSAPLQEALYPAGAHTIPFDGSGLPSGIYFARLTAGEFSQVQKLVLLK